MYIDIEMIFFTLLLTKNVCTKVDLAVSQPENKSLDCIIDLTFRNIKRLLVLSFKASENGPTRISFDKYCDK